MGEREAPSSAMESSYMERKKIQLTPSTYPGGFCWTLWTKTWCYLLAIALHYFRWKPHSRGHCSAKNLSRTLPGCLSFQCISTGYLSPNLKFCYLSLATYLLTLAYYIHNKCIQNLTYGYHRSFSDTTEQFHPPYRQSFTVI